MYQRILVATDGSRLSRKAVVAALALAKPLGATVVGFHARPNYLVPYYGEVGIMMPPDAEKTFDRQTIAAAEKYLGAIEQLAAKAGVPYKGVHVRSSSTSDAILAAARKDKCDLVVMASHGRRGISRLLMGSETNQVLTHSKIPVLVVR